MTSAEALAAPALVDPSSATLELVTPSAAEQAKLDQVDGLAFDAYGNLLAALEIYTNGAVVYIDKATGIVTTLLTNIDHPDQIALDPSGDMWFQREVSPASTSDRIFRMTVGYDGSNHPIAAGTSATSLTTSVAIDIPEGLVVLESDGPYGNAGDLLGAEDADPGSIFRVQPGTGTTTTLASGLSRPEGAAFGSFGGQLPDALYVAETNVNAVKRIDADGTVTLFGDPGAVGLIMPDNVEFGPDGYLYVSEDRSAPNSRIIRIASDGTHTVFATGFGQAQGMIFDANGDLYISEQDFDRIWRVRFLGCGDGSLDAGEDCDNGAGNGTAGQCCSATCSFESAATECRASADVCDVAELCTGSSGTCPADGFVSGGTLCRGSAGACDAIELCTGGGPSCPADGFVSAGAECRASAGICDVAEQCTGSGAACSPDGFVAGGTECRASADACDVAEQCTGAGAACPADGYAAAGTECRASADLCDAAEQCSGTGAACPADGLASAGTECRAVAGACDVAEQCTGASPSCPADGFQSAGLECRAVAGLCDVAEQCTGAGPACPTDGFVAPFTLCRGSSGACDAIELCTGTLPTCPSDGFVIAGSECRGVAGACDVAEQCTGVDPQCPANGFVAGGTECRASAGMCDVAEQCTGSGPSCPADGFASGTTPCDDAVSCTEGETCDGAGACQSGAPNDGLCDDSLFCNGAETCDLLLDCQPGLPPQLSPDGVGCTEAVCDELNDRIAQVPVHANCVDSNACNGSEWCHPINDCQPAFQGLDCDDGNACTADSCDAVTGCANVPLANCIVVPAVSRGGRALLSLLVVGAGALWLSRRRVRTPSARIG